METARVVEVRREGACLGYVAVDSTVGGQSCGGLRMLPDVSADELRILARQMTFKYGLLGLPQGGAKGGVIGDPDAPAEVRRSTLRRFGEAIRDMLASGAYRPGPDMGTTNEEIAAMLRDIGIPFSRRDLQVKDSGYYTALGVFAGAREAGRRCGLSLAGARCVIQGFGKVGAALAQFLDAAGARVVAVATSRGGLVDNRGLDVPLLLKASRERGSGFVESFPAERWPADRILEVDCEFLFPCARHHAIHDENVERITARVISAGANAACTPSAESRLLDRGAVCLPDFVTNCGGVLGGTMEFAGIPQPAVRRMMEPWISELVRSLLDAAARTGIPARRLAETFALERHAAIQKSAENPTPSEQLVRWGVRAYRSCLAPRWLVRRFAEKHFEALMSGVRFA